MLTRWNCINIIFVLGCYVRYVAVMALLLGVSTGALRSDELEGRIEDATRSLEKVRSSVLSLENDLLLKQQSLSRLNRHIEGIKTSFPKPRDKEIENELYAFEKARGTVKQFVDEQGRKMAKFVEKAEGLERDLNDLKKEQLRFGKDKVALRIDDLKDAEPPEPDPFEEFQRDVFDLMDKSDEDLENLKADRSYFREKVEIFNKRAEEISREANESIDMIYDIMLAQYEGIKSQGWIIIGARPPKKPEGYDRRLEGRLAAGGGSGQQPVYVAPKNASEKSNEQQRIDDLKEQIKNTSDPQEKANLEQLLNEIESAQK